MKLSKNAITILEKRYLLRDENNKIIETPEQMIDRVVNHVCDSDELKNKAKELMLDLKFLPNTPTLMNSGSNRTLSACYVLPIQDSLKSILETLKWQSYIHKAGGGVGINFSNLRPVGDMIKTTGGVTSGVLSFIKNFDTMSGSIHQGGKRDGANMTILSCYHPQIEDFITIKTKNNKDYENMNFSVLIDDNFMKAVMEDSEISLSFPVKSNNIRKKVKAKYLFDLICESAWKCGCPGILFEDAINKTNILRDYMWMDSTNPCGEQCLFCGKVPSNIFVDEHSNFDMTLNVGEPIAESCNLGSLNLSVFVEDNTGIFKFKELGDAVITAVEFLDCVIDANTYQFGDEKFGFIEKGTKLTRKIGLGITGFHEMLVKMGISYGSKESIEWAEKVMSFINEKSNDASIKLANRKGVYPLAHLVNDKRRNATTTTIAPTGTIGRFMLGYGHALGIEPPFALYIESKIIESTLNEGVYPPLIKILQEQCNKKLVDDIIEKIKQNGKSIQNIEEIPIKIRELFRTADEIPIEQHIAIQAAFQRHTQNAVSKTINLDNGATITDVHKAFLMAYNNGLKGITIYRNGSKDTQVLNVPELTKKAPTPRPRYKDHIAIIREIESACGVTYCGISFDKYGLFEVFPINSGKGGCIASQEAIGRSGSTMLRFNVPVETIIKQFGRVKCNSCLTKDEFYDKNNKFIGIKSCSHGLSKQMNDYYSNPQLINDLIKLQTKIHEIFNHNDINDNLINDFREIKTINKDNTKHCPDCKIPLIRQEGCSSEGCPNCGRGGCS